MNHFFSSSTRDYSSWNIHDIHGTTLDIPPNLDPIEYKLFSGDEISITPTISIISSTIRAATKIAGVLQLHGNNTFGRTQNGRLLYKCIPHQKNLPAFLVPYNVKPGFDKSNVNKYVIFCFASWEQKHPHGSIVETLGNVNELTPFYEYQMYCSDLLHSVTRLTHTVHEKLREGAYDDHIGAIQRNDAFKIVDKTSEYVFTIDPVGSVDLDDGLSIVTDLDNPDHTIVSVYIAHLGIWLEHLNLWNELSDRVSTIYLPDCKRNMLPSMLSDNWCSLNEKEQSVVFAMDLVFDQRGNIICDIKPRFYNAMIRVRKNFRYEEPKLLKNTHYHRLAQLTSRVDPNVRDSHEVVALWMMRMNLCCAEALFESKTGVFRTATMLDREPNLPSQFSTETQRALSMWNNVSGSYQLYDAKSDLNHAMMENRKYVQITSPIRRLVDVLNQLMFCTLVQTHPFSDEAYTFLHKWTTNMNMLNTSMKSIRKLQGECEMVHMCYTHPDIVHTTYAGIVFDKQIGKKDDFIYMVYLEDLRKLVRLKTTCELDEYSEHRFQLFLFETEDNCRRKIRIGLV
jgi:exoribonuclease R